MASGVLSSRQVCPAGVAAAASSSLPHIASRSFRAPLGECVFLHCSLISLGRGGEFRVTLGGCQTKNPLVMGVIRWTNYGNQAAWKSLREEDSTNLLPW
jgi:predicted dienelactone hydrolase